MPAGSVRWFTSDMTGVDKLTTAKSSFTDILKKCLIDGFDTNSIDSLTHSGSTATVIISGGHNYVVDQVINITGANEAEYNGSWVVSNVSATDFTFELIASPVSPATGTITAKVAEAAGWSIAFEDVANGILVLRSDEVTGARYYYKFTDDNFNDGKSVRVDVYESMTDIDTGVSLVTGKYLHKVYDIDNSTYFDTGTWVIVADGEFIHIFTHSGEHLRSNQAFAMSHYMLGAINSYADGDAHHALVSLAPDTTTWDGVSINNPSMVLGRTLDNVTRYTEVECCIGRTVLRNVTSNTGIRPMGAFNRANGDVYFDQVYVIPKLDNGDVPHIRGELPGLMNTSDNTGFAFEFAQVVVGVEQFTDDKFIVVTTTDADLTTQPPSPYSTYTVAVKITGDWR